MVVRNQTDSFSEKYTTHYEAFETQRFITVYKLKNKVKIQPRIITCKVVYFNLNLEFTAKTNRLSIKSCKNLTTSSKSCQQVLQQQVIKSC